MALSWITTMDQTPPEVALMLAVLECGVFWIERMITITLTPLWIHSYFYLFSYSKESFIFYHAAAASVDAFLFTNTLFLVCLFIRTSINAPPNQDPQDDDRKKLLTIERYAFCIERSGMVLLSILCLPLGLTDYQFLHISRASCIVLFPIANILYLESFIFGCLKEKGDSFENLTGGNNEIADVNHQDRGLQAEEKDDTSPFIPNVCSCATYAEERETETQEHDGSSGTSCLEKLGTETHECDDILGMGGLKELGSETQEYDGIPDIAQVDELGKETQEYDDISGTSCLEGLGIETQEYDDNIPDLEEIEETKEEATKEEKEADKVLSKGSFEMLSVQDDQMQGGIQELEKEITIDHENYQKMLRFEMLNIQVHQMTREIEILEKQFATAKQKYKKKLKKVEDKWEKKLKKVAVNYRKERKIWEEQDFDIVSRLSALASQAEFYYIQAQDSEENHRKLEDEKIDLMMKLCAANACSEVYRSLLHDDLRSTMHTAD